MSFMKHGVNYTHNKRLPKCPPVKVNCLSVPYALALTLSWWMRAGALTDWWTWGTGCSWVLTLHRMFIDYMLAKFVLNLWIITWKHTYIISRPVTICATSTITTCSVSIMKGHESPVVSLCDLRVIWQLDKHCVRNARTMRKTRIGLCSFWQLST